MIRQAVPKAGASVLKHVACLLLLWAVGCMGQSGADWREAWGQPRRNPQVSSNIVRVNKFFSVDPWLSFSADGSGKIEGVRFSVYLEDAKVPKGVFGTGTLLVEMYRIDRDPNGREKTAKIFEWELPPDKAYPWRAKRETMMGWGYGLRLQWDPALDIEGQLVAFVVRYVHEDGRVCSSSRQVLKIPLAGSRTFEMS